MTTLAVSALLVLVLARLGKHLQAVLPGHDPRSPVGFATAWMTGTLLLHLLLSLLQECGIPWTRPVLLGVLLGALGLLEATARRRRPGSPRSDWPRAWPPPLGWGDAAAAAAVGVYLVAGYSLRSVNPDFIFHWGIKAKRAWLAGGIDYEWLAAPWSHHAHSEYPHLLPELFATAAALVGRFDERGLLGGSAIFLAALVVASRRLLLEQQAPWPLVQAGIAAVAGVATAFSIGYLQPGGTDLLIAVALVSGGGTLLRPPGPQRDLALGVAAGFAAAAKLEGVLLAGFLLLWEIPRRLARRSASWPALARLVLPLMLGAGPWLLGGFRHELFTGGGPADFDLARSAVVGSALLASMNQPVWHGLSWLLLALPPLTIGRRFRPPAAVALLQLMGYLYVYFASPLDPDFYVRSSFPRLVLHLLPIPILGLVLALGAWAIPHPRPGGEATGRGS